MLPIGFEFVIALGAALGFAGYKAYTTCCSRHDKHDTSVTGDTFPTHEHVE